jgi:hypothetical protein
VRDGKRCSTVPIMVFGDAKAVISDIAGALRAEQEGQAAA